MLENSALLSIVRRAMDIARDEGLDDGAQATVAVHAVMAACPALSDQAVQEIIFEASDPASCGLPM